MAYHVAESELLSRRAIAETDHSSARAFRVPRPYGYASVRAVPGGVTRQSRNHAVTSGLDMSAVNIARHGVMRDPYAATRRWRIVIGSASSSR